ncbi:LysR family transcriptional regulator [Companilactobacillus kimchiensis]|uniref:LysR family transcriptional regulator n=2 Tax=Companilactobacillus kimchiensis TaxID=993692 RepID=A0A0R2LGH0_9LACO|nr:LysR family transcriptional regulator [Companilactobacillus kimchiensis]
MIAREENITKAAKLLHVSQPTLSRQIANLEGELGVKLFVRQSHKISLTEDGLLLRRRAEEMRQLNDKILEEMSADKEDLAGEISIGSGELHSMVELADIITKFHQRYPLVKFNMQSGNSEDIKLAIEQGLLDLGLLIEPVDTEKYSFTRMHQHETWGILVANDSPLAKLPFVTPTDLKGESLIMSKSHPMVSEMNHWFGSALKDIKIISTYNLLYNSAILVKQGLGIALCLKLESNYEGVNFVPLQPKLSYNSVLAWKADQISSRTVSEFIDFAKKYLKDMS